MKILHTGDTHLGDLNGPVKDGKNVRRADTLNCMRAIVDEARRELPHVTIVAGDLFNRSRVWADTALEDVSDATTEFIRPLCRCSEHVVVLFGTENHDNPRAFSLLQELTKDEKNLHIYATPQVETLNTSEGPVQIAALPGFDRGRLRLFCPGADKEAENRNATALINEVLLGLAGQLSPTVPSVLVAHYTVSGSEADNGTTFLAGQDVVILPDTIDAGHFTLACFGHIHHPQRLNCHTPAFYCGSPNQLTFNDEGTTQGFYIHEFPAVPLFAPGECPPIPAGDTHRFIPTPARAHFTLTMAAEEVADFITAGTLPELPGGAADAVVRVRYTCSAEQEKAFNRAELQKKLLAAGAFHVAEVLPEDVEEAGTGEDLTEHDGPAEALVRWMEASNIPDGDAERLKELAAPIIRTADDGREAGKHAGAFTPLRVEVKNYRSYTAAEFDFSPIHMAMVNGPNGIGKSSMFMDSVADCLFEQSRQEDIGGWVRDGTKSGSITFEFSMGGATYRVIRTRTKAGRGSLALHRKDAETGEWADESDTTMKLTQARIERLIGMDCGTFCSIALIRQDAYGLFLEAGSDRRMEVLSALLGLDVYVRMEADAKAKATDCRRQMAAANERLRVLEEQIAEKGCLLGEDNDLASQAEALRDELSVLEAAISAAQRAEATRGELLRQLGQKRGDAAATGAQAEEKRREAENKRADLEAARETAAKTNYVEFSAKALEAARAKLEELAPKEEELRTLHRDLGEVEAAVAAKSKEVSSLHQKRESFVGVMTREEKITQAVAELESLRGRRAEVEYRRAEREKADAEVREARHDKDVFLAESRARIGKLQEAVEVERRKMFLLENSGCPIADNATCSLLADAVAAKAALPALEAELESVRTKDRAEYDRLCKAYTNAGAVVGAMGDPAGELEEIAAWERALLPLADLAPSLEGARASVDSLDAQISAIGAEISAAEERMFALRTELPALNECAAQARKAREEAKGAEEAAKMLPACKAAAATVAALEPQVAALKAEAMALEQRSAAMLQEAAELEERIPEPTNTDSLVARRVELQGRINDVSAGRGGVKARLEAVAQAEAQAADKRAEKAGIARSLNDYTTLAAAFGLDGIQYMIIRGVVPEITRRANDILAAMTGGKMAVDIRTEREQKSTKQIVNSLEVWINSLSGGSRPYLSHSGGEKVKIALAVTLALADVKARRAGVQLGMLFIDEPPFLDADGTEAYADALASMAARNPGMRILAISHDPAMKARFGQNITVSAGEDGSMVSMD